LKPCWPLWEYGVNANSVREKVDLPPLDAGPVMGVLPRGKSFADCGLRQALAVGENLTGPAGAFSIDSCTKRLGRRAVSPVSAQAYELLVWHTITPVGPFEMSFDQKLFADALQPFMPLPASCLLSFINHKPHS
jgi:hypothetical protein